LDDDDSDGSGEDWSSELADADGILCYQLRLDPLMARLTTEPAQSLTGLLDDWGGAYALVSGLCGLLLLLHTARERRREQSGEQSGEEQSGPAGVGDPGIGAAGPVWRVPLEHGSRLLARVRDPAAFERHVEEKEVEEGRGAAGAVGRENSPAVGRAVGREDGEEGEAGGAVRVVPPPNRHSSVAAESMIHIVQASIGEG